MRCGSSLLCLGDYVYDGIGTVKSLISLQICEKHCMLK